MIQESGDVAGVVGTWWCMGWVRWAARLNLRDFVGGGGDQERARCAAAVRGEWLVVLQTSHQSRDSFVVFTSFASASL